MSAMDDKTEAAFRSYGLIDEETEARFAKERAETEAVVAALESKFFSRGLKFTQPFAGYVPVQAFGHVDGMRFYFRYRHGYASLRVGPFNQELENALWSVHESDRLGRLAKVVSEDKDPFDFLLKDSTPRVTEDAADYYPHEVRATAGVKFGDEYDGYLTADEAFEVFSSLLEEKLTAVPEEQWIDGFNRAALEGTVDEYRQRVFGMPPV